MSDNFYSGSLTRTQERNAWAVIFRHPKRTDPTTGKERLRVRQSLKTDDEAEAATLRDQINTLLASPQLWNLGAREQALAPPSSMRPSSISSSTNLKAAKPTSSRWVTA